MADHHYHYVNDVQGAAEERHSHGELESRIRDLDYDIRQRAGEHHRHHDTEQDVRVLRADLDDARERLATLQSVLSAHLAECGQHVSAAAVTP